MVRLGEILKYSMGKGVECDLKLYEWLREYNDPARVERVRFVKSLIDSKLDPRIKDLG